MPGAKMDYSPMTVDTIGKILERKQSVARLLTQTQNGLNQVFERDTQSPEDLVYELFKVPQKDEACVGRLLAVLKSFGLREDDPRLHPMMVRVRDFECQVETEAKEAKLQRHWVIRKQLFKECISESLTLITQTLRNNLVVPCWAEFCHRMKSIYTECKAENGGSVATYIPQLARRDPNSWGISICTVDGQRVSFGDATVPFCFQSVSKAFNYAILASDIGADAVHSFVGQEPSGRFFNDICLDTNNKPHNPMINAGAIVVTSLMKTAMPMADRFDYVLNEYKKMSAGEFVGFNNSTYLSERTTADRNFALAYYMRESECFPQAGSHSVSDILDFYFQLCSLEGTCESLSVMAATLANGAKSGVSGALVVVIPNLLGICMWSPPLDKLGNSFRGVRFCQEMIKTFKFHNYDSLLHSDVEKFDPRKRTGDSDAEQIVHLLFAAKHGDMTAIRRFYMQGSNLQMTDYDKRTALHLAASEGHVDMVKFLLNVAKVKHDMRDRFGRTPLDDATQFKHDDCITLLTKANNRRSHGNLASLLSKVSSNHSMGEDGDWYKDMRDAPIREESCLPTEDDDKVSLSTGTSESNNGDESFDDDEQPDFMVMRGGQTKGGGGGGSRESGYLTADLKPDQHDRVGKGAFGWEKVTATSLV